MALVQVGYFGTQGPVFVDDSTVAGKFILFQAHLVNGVMKLFAVQPDYATALGPSFPYTAAQCTLGPYTNNLEVSVAPAYTQPQTLGSSFSNKDNSWVAANTSGNVNTTSTGSTSTGTTTTSTGTTTTNTGTTTTGGTDSGTLFSPANAASTVEDFLSKYWWAVLLVAIALLWKPLIAPALGIKTSRRRR